ncbi:DUF3786 domain-containing protein [Desulfococcus sp.]|uniref:DUF3786 domain-containing protein n=1 Tax=Desulfococcus sp. TaxID=2025834 RepID=UPI0035949450
MKETSPVFEENYQYYLDRLGAVHLPSLAEVLGAGVEDDGLAISFFGRPHRISAGGVIGPDGGRPSYSTCIILFKYVLLCPENAPPGGPWTSFKDFRDAGPLVVFFTNEVEALLAHRFQGERSRLASVAKQLGGRTPEEAYSHDLAVQFDPLPRVSMLMLFNDRDEEFPAGCSVLFEKRTENYLDMESVAVLGHVLSGTLVQLKNAGIP